MLEDEVYEILLESKIDNNRGMASFLILSILKCTHHLITVYKMQKAIDKLIIKGLIEKRFTPENFIYYEALSPHEIAKNKCKTQ